MRKKYIVALGVVLLFFVGFLIYRHTQKKGELSKHQEKTNSMMVEMAKRSPTGGMMHMGSALKNYFKDNDTYPISLQGLYPKYVASRPFIEEIPWDYEPKGDDFSLKKSFVQNNRQMFASLDKTLRPRIEAGFMVASASVVSKTVLAKEPDTKDSTKPVTSEKTRLALHMEQPTQEPPEKAVSTESERLSEEEYARPAVPQAFALVSVETATGPTSEASKQYLVWRDKNGILGFGNIDYPDVEALGICADGKWFNVKRVPQETEELVEPQYVALESPRTFFGVVIGQ